MEEDLFCALATIADLQKTNELKDKFDNLENRSRRSNLRLVGLPENIPPPALLHFCQTTLPKLLAIDKDCVVVRVHRLGQPVKENKPPRSDRS